MLSIDDGYADGAIGTARSIAATLHSARVTFHVLDGGLGVPTSRRIEHALRPIGGVSFYEVPGLPDVAPSSKHYDASAALGRLFLGRALPRHLSRVIYLDADTLVRESLTALDDADLGQNAVGAVLNEVSPTQSVRVTDSVTRADVGAERPGFFISGVLLVDLERWRAVGATERAADLCRRVGTEFHGIDQEMLNVVFAGRWTPLDPRWNTWSAATARCPGRSSRSCPRAASSTSSER